MPAETDLYERQAALGVRRAEDAGTGQRARVVLRVVRDEELVRRLAREALGAVPRHVLDHEQGAVGDEDVIEGTVADDGLVEPLDHAGEDGEPAWGRGVGPVPREDVVVGALHPFSDWRVDGLLHVRAVEVDGGSVGNVIERAGESEDVPEKRARGGDLVDVKAGIDEHFGVEDGIP